MYIEPSIIELPKIKDLRGNLTFLEDNNQIPFKIERVYWVYDVPGGEDRGGHAYTNTTELIIPLSGGITVETYYGGERNEFNLNITNKGLLIHPMTWRKVGRFLSNSICLVITNKHYQDCDYIRNFNEYIKLFKRSL